MREHEAVRGARINKEPAIGNELGRRFAGEFDRRRAVAVGTVTVFGTPNDVTLSELALEMLFPADDATARIAHAMVEELESAA